MALDGKVGLIVGVANQHSIGAGCAMAMAAEGARLAMTYLNAKAAPYVEPVAKAAGVETLVELDVRDDASIAAVFDAVSKMSGKLDFLVHSIAFCPKDDLHSKVIDCSRTGFAEAMDVSCYSFIRLVREAAPLMKNGGSVMTISYHGAEEVVDNYNIMGPVKAALESTVRYLAADLGERNIRVNAISPGPIATRAASGIDHFDEILDDAAKRAPQRMLCTIEDVGDMAAFLASDKASAVTGGVHYVDCGFNIVA